MWPFRPRQRQRPANVAEPVGWARTPHPAVVVSGMPEHVMFTATWPDVGGADEKELLSVAYRLGRAMFTTAAVEPDGDHPHPVVEGVRFSASQYQTPADDRVAGVATMVFERLCGSRRKSDKQKPLLRPDQMFPRRVHEDDE